MSQVTRETLEKVDDRTLRSYAKFARVPTNLSRKETIDLIFASRTKAPVLHKDGSFRKPIFERQKLAKAGIPKVPGEITLKAGNKRYDPHKTLVLQLGRQEEASSSLYTYSDSESGHTSSEVPTTNTGESGLSRTTSFLDILSPVRNYLTQNLQSSAPTSPSPPPHALVDSVTSDPEIGDEDDNEVADTDDEDSEPEVTVFTRLSPPDHRFLRNNVFPTQRPPPSPVFSDDAEDPDPQSDEEEDSYGSTGRRDSPPLVDFVYPPLPPLDINDPLWLEKMLTDLERQRQNLKGELEDLTNDIKDALADITIAEGELAAEVKSYIDLMNELHKLAPQAVREAVDDAKKVVQDAAEKDNDDVVFLALRSDIFEEPPDDIPQFYFKMQNTPPPSPPRLIGANAGPADRQQTPSREEETANGDAPRGTRRDYVSGSSKRPQDGPALTTRDLSKRGPSKEKTPQAGVVRYKKRPRDDSASIGAVSTSGLRPIDRAKSIVNNAPFSSTSKSASPPSPKRLREEEARLDICTAKKSRLDTIPEDDDASFGSPELSERARGKQRAVSASPEREHNPSSSVDSSDDESGPDESEESQSLLKPRRWNIPGLGGDVDIPVTDIVQGYPGPIHYREGPRKKADRTLRRTRNQVTWDEEGNIYTWHPDTQLRLTVDPTIPGSSGQWEMFTPEEETTGTSTSTSTYDYNKDLDEIRAYMNGERGSYYPD